MFVHRVACSVSETTAHRVIMHGRRADHFSALADESLPSRATLCGFLRTVAFSLVLPRSIAPLIWVSSCSYEVKMFMQVLCRQDDINLQFISDWDLSDWTRLTFSCTSPNEHFRIFCQFFIHSVLIMHYVVAVFARFILIFSPKFANGNESCHCQIPESQQKPAFYAAFPYASTKLVCFGVQWWCKKS